MSLERALARALHTEAARAYTALDPDEVVGRARRRRRAVVATSSTGAVIAIAVALVVPSLLLNDNEGSDRSNLADPPPVVLPTQTEPAQPQPAQPQPAQPQPTEFQPTEPEAATPEPAEPDPDRPEGQAEQPGGSDQSEDQTGQQGIRGEPEERRCGSAGGASNIVAKGVGCEVAREVAASAEGEDGNPYDARGFSCQPERAEGGDTNYTCTGRQDDETITFTT